MIKPTLTLLKRAWIPMDRPRTKTVLFEIISETKKGRPIKNHWAGCWEVHRKCAMRELGKL